MAGPPLTSPASFAPRPVRGPRSRRLGSQVNVTHHLIGRNQVAKGSEGALQSFVDRSALRIQAEDGTSNTKIYLKAFVGLS